MNTRTLAGYFLCKHHKVTIYMKDIDTMWMFFFLNYFSVLVLLHRVSRANAMVQASIRKTCFSERTKRINAKFCGKPSTILPDHFFWHCSKFWILTVFFFFVNMGPRGSENVFIYIKTSTPPTVIILFQAKLFSVSPVAYSQKLLLGMLKFEFN